MNRFDHTRTFLCVITMIMLLIFLSSCQTSKQSQGTNPAHHDTVVIDKDGNRYPVKRLKDNHLWMTANLNLNTRESYYYNDSSHYNERYGRLYTWAAAQQGCASLGEGWRLPTRDEWYRLAENYKPITKLRRSLFKDVISFFIKFYGYSNAHVSYRNRNAEMNSYGVFV